MRLRASEVAMVGDSSIDVMTGQQAGPMPAGVTWGFRDRQNLIDAGVQYLVDRRSSSCSTCEHEHENA